MQTLAAVILALGLALGGLSVGVGFARGRAADRFVEVKGLSEKPVKATLALWPLRFVVSANSLAEAQASASAATSEVLAFFKRQGIDPAAAELQNLQVTDSQTEMYRQDRSGPRFVITQTVMVRSADVDTVIRASQRVSELVGAGIVLSSSGEFGGAGPTYLFTGINELKPAMIAEATSNARAAAEQFARDSGSSLGGIKQANQGVFVILPRDQAPGVQEGSQPEKIVRVVSTIQYFLD
jgi:uncharacterized protein